MVNYFSAADLYSINYKQAVNHYNNMKREFLNQYAKIARETNLSILENDFITKFSKEVEEESVEAELEKAKSLFSNIAKTMTQRQDKKQQNINLSKARKEAKKFQKIGEQELELLAHMLISEEEMKNIVSESLAHYGSGFESVNILQQARSYMREVVRARVIPKSGGKFGTNNPRILSRAQKTKGYFREALVYTALSKVLQVAENSNVVSIKPMGQENTKIDTLIQFSNFNYSENISLPIHFGVQDKSWIRPWTEKAKYQVTSEKARYFYTIGNNSELCKEALADGYTTWAQGVYFLSKQNNPQRAIGEKNVLYVLGDGVVFTSDLISQMRQNKYFIAFIYRFNQQQITPTITWQSAATQIQAYNKEKNKTYQNV